MSNPRVRWLLMIALALPKAALSAGAVQAGLDVGYDDNTSLASSRDDRRSSALTRLRLDWHGGRTLPGQPRLLLSAHGEAVDVARARGLSVAAAHLQAGVLWRHGRSFAAPTLGLLIAAGHREFESDMRDADWGRLRAVVHSQWTTRLGVRAGAFARLQSAGHGVFDQTRGGLEAGVDWQPRAGHRLYMDLNISDGDATVLARPPAPVAMRARKIAPDDVFTGFNAYRVDARGSGATLGYIQRLTPTLAVHASASADTLKPEGGDRYTRHTARAGLRWTWR